MLREFGLEADIPISYRNIGLKKPHPVLRLKDLVATLNKAGKLHHLFAGNNGKSLENFWAQYRLLHPGHDVFTRHSQHLSSCLPMMMHLDEGTTHKKKSLMILSAQIVCGQGSRRAPGHNFLGSTYLSRFLFSVLLGRTYARQKKVLYDLLDAWATDLTECYQDGIRINDQDTIWPVILSCKGDWPAVAKAGRLQRNFMRDAPSSGSPPGICHLCRAGMLGYPWNSFEANAAWLHADSPIPWTTPSPLAKIPQDSSNPASFYAVDLFHVCHKGVVADYVASSIVARPKHASVFFRGFRVVYKHLCIQIGAFTVDLEDCVGSSGRCGFSG